MGNCIKSQGISRQEDEEWEVESMEEMKEKKGKPMDVKVVKIRITKKQLAELLSKADLPVQQVLSFMSSGNVGVSLRRRGRQWRPALQTIPEMMDELCS